MFSCQNGFNGNQNDVTHIIVDQYTKYGEVWTETDETTIRSLLYSGILSVIVPECALTHLCGDFN